MLSVAEVSELEVGRAGAQEVEAQRSRASTSRGDAAGKQLRGGEARARSTAALGRGARDPHRITVASPIPPFPVFCKIPPKFELKSNFCQNKSSSEFCTLQNLFKDPELILSGIG